MSAFPGFTSAETFTQVPDSLFRLLNEIEDLGELKVTLYVLWQIEHMQGAQLFISRAEMAEDAGFMSKVSAAELDQGLEQAVRRGTLLRLEGSGGGLYVLNSPRGRATAEALARSASGESAHSPLAMPRQTPNIFKLYEENIGALTPLMADALKDAERDFPAEWIAEAFAEAVSRNKRNWKYVEAILKRWKEEGRAEKQNRRDAEENRGSDVNRKVEEFLKRK
jgi:DnaD/phage-associated family protein